MFKLNPLVAAISLAMIFPVATMASDTGDAPASFGLATHEVVVGAPQLGELAPDDNDPVSTADALGDDNDVTPDDEDGVFAFPQLVQNSKSFSTNVFVNNPSGQAATLVGWIDYDGNGTFDADEGVSAPVPAGQTTDLPIKLLWPDNFALSTDFFGPTYARFRVSTDPITVSDALGGATDGEVEDYTFDILEDSDGDEIPNTLDLDNDNDGIPDSVEGLTDDRDGDGFPNFLDVDSDGDSIPDFAEAGRSPTEPQDTDGDGTPDYLDLDSNNDGTNDIFGDAADSDGDGIPDSVEGNVDSDGDGIVDSQDIDSDNDIIPDAVEAANVIGADASNPVDTDGDLIPDYLDLDSDNDGIPDIYESNTNEISIEALDADVDGRADSSLVFGTNGYVDDIETDIDSGVPIFAIPDTDVDSVRDFRDTDSDNDGANDVVEAGSTDTDNNGLLDVIVDANQNNVPDVYDAAITGGADANNNGIDDMFDAAVSSGADADGDGILDSVDLDVNADGIVDTALADQINTLFQTGVFIDLDGDFNPDFRDADSVAGDANTAVPPVVTTPGEPADPGQPAEPVGETVTPIAQTPGTTAPTTGIVETGLSGTACSISGRPGNDPMFPGLLLLSSLVMFGRRKKMMEFFKR